MAQPLFAEEVSVWGAGLGDAVRVEDERLSRHETQRGIPELRVVENAEHPSRTTNLLDRAAGPEQERRRMAGARDVYPDTRGAVLRLEPDAGGGAEAILR